VVDTNETLRQRALRLINLGCSQKIMAGKMGMQPATLSRWINQKDGIGPVSVAALDGFNAYVDELREALTDVDTIRQSGVTKFGAPGADPKESTGNPKETNGRALAGSTVTRPHAQTDPVSHATRAEVRRTVGDLERLARPAEQAGALERSAHAARVARQHAATTRQAKARARAPVRKRRR